MRIGYLLSWNSKLKMSDITRSMTSHINYERKKGVKKPPNIHRGTIFNCVWLDYCKISYVKQKVVITSSILKLNDPLE